MAVSQLRSVRAPKGALPTVVALPSKRDINIALNIVLLGLVVLSFVSGWIASWLGLTELGLHKWSSVGFMVVVVAHLALHWRALAAQLRRLRS